jgi:hypothetical protein
MKAIIVAPKVSANNDEGAENRRLGSYIEPIADYISNLIGKDPALFAVRSKNEVSEKPVPTDLIFGDIEAVKIVDLEMLKKILVASGDPNSGQFMSIRSLVTCSSVTYGFDGQALICLPEEVRVEKPDGQKDFTVEDCTSDLAGTDWFDGSQLIAGYNDFPSS